MFQVKYKTKCLEDRVEIIHFRLSDTLSPISDILKDNLFLQQRNANYFTSYINI